MDAYEILQTQGYITPPKAAEMMGMAAGGNVVPSLKKLGVECIELPTKNGKGARSKWLCNAEDIRAKIKASAPMAAGTENGGKLSRRCMLLENRVEALERELADLKEALGV